MQRNKFHEKELVLVNPFVVDKEGNPIPLPIPDEAKKMEGLVKFKKTRGMGSETTLLTLNGVTLGEGITEKNRKRRIKNDRKVTMYTDFFDRTITMPTREELLSILKINIAPSVPTVTTVLPVTNVLPVLPPITKKPQLISEDKLLVNLLLVKLNQVDTSIGKENFKTAKKDYISLVTECIESIPSSKTTTYKFTSSSNSNLFFSESSNIAIPESKKRKDPGTSKITQQPFVDTSILLSTPAVTNYNGATSTKKRIRFTRA
jgi:hypothetical protein